VKLLFDENLSRKLVARPSDLYPDSIHAAEVDLCECPDEPIWEYAKASGYIIVTADPGRYATTRTRPRYTGSRSLCRSSANNAPRPRSVRKFFAT
jgi:hypothetical protein